MSVQTKRRNAVENGDTGIDPALTTLIIHGEDLGPIVRHAFEAGKPEALLNQLRNIVKKKEVEIEELCKAHYEDFILAVDELRDVLVDADDLKSMLSGENSQLQEVASSLLLKLEKLLELYSIKKNVAETIKTLRICVEVLNLCMICNRHISDARFYPALKTLNLIEKDHLLNIPVKALRMVIEKQIPAIKFHIEEKICSEFNDWLVLMRNTATDIGQLAIGQAASARQRDEKMHARQREAGEQSHSGFGEYVYTLDIEEIDENSVLEFDLTPVYRTHQGHTFLGIEEQFRDYYFKNRMMQLNLDLQVSSEQPFLESHQHFFAQIAGFFIVEDRVFRTADGLLSGSQVETMWDTSVSKMTSILEDQLSHIEIASHLLLIKDFVTLFGATLGRFGYQVTPLLEVLDNSRDKYHDLLLDECRKQLVDILSHDTFEQMVMRREYEHKMTALTFNLKSSDVVFPYVAPFCSSVPDTCHIVSSFIDDSVRYLSYGCQINFYDVVKKYLDKLLIDVVNDTLLNMIHDGTPGVSQAMQIAANIAVFECACDLFLFQAGQRCGVPVRVVERPHIGLTAKAVLKTSKNAAYDAILNLINSKLDDFIVLMNNINWTADEAPQDGNEYMNAVVIFLESLVSTGQQILPLGALHKVTIGALDHISDFIVTAFLSENVKRFTVNAVIGIDSDLKKLESFADESFRSTGLGDLKKDKSLKDCLLEPRQLLNLLLSNQAENFMNPIIREKHYGALDYKKVACICEKFKDAKLSKRNAKQNARKKSLEMLKKRLKDFN